MGSLSMQPDPRPKIRVRITDYQASAPGSRKVLVQDQTDNISNKGEGSPNTSNKRKRIITITTREDYSFIGDSQFELKEEDVPQVRIIKTRRKSLENDAAEFQEFGANQMGPPPQVSNRPTVRAKSVKKMKIDIGPYMAPPKGTVRKTRPSEMSHFLRSLIKSSQGPPQSHLRPPVGFKAKTGVGRLNK